MSKHDLQVLGRGETCDEFFLEFINFVSYRRLFFVMFSYSLRAVADYGVTMESVPANNMNLFPSLH